MDNSGFLFKPDTVKIGDAVYEVGFADHAVLRKQREDLGLTQQAVATACKIDIRQYQRYESGERSLLSASFRIGVAVCRVLKLDPFVLA